MNPSRPIRQFAALLAATSAFSFAGSQAGGAQQNATTFSAQDPGASPMPTTTPHALRPIIMVTATPWKYGIAPEQPKARAKVRSAKAKPRANDAAKPAVLPTAVRTLSPSGSVEPESGATTIDVAPPPALAPAPLPTPSASPSPSPSPAAARASRQRPAAPRATPSPTATPNDGTAPVYDTPPPRGGDLTPIPTQPPTPRPLAPSQPSIPDSLSDPNVRGIIARPIRQLSQVGWMQGTWSVTGVTNKEDGTTVPLEPTTYVFSPIMQNRWMFGADGKAQDYIYLTFDPFARHWVALRFGSNPSYGMWTSDRGWVGNRIDFLTNFSYVNGRQYRRRLTIIHKDARTFGIYETEQTPDGSFIPDDAYEFKKS